MRNKKQTKFYSSHRAKNLRKRTSIRRPSFIPEQSSIANIALVRRMVAIAFIACTGVWMFYFFFISDNFSVQNVSIEGTENIPREELEEMVAESLAEKRFRMLPNKNIFLFSKKSLLDTIHERYIVENISVRKVMPNTLRISINEKLARVLVRTQYEVTVEEKEFELVVSNTAVVQEIASSTDEREEHSTDLIEEEDEPPEPVYITNYYLVDVNGIVVSPAQEDGEEAQTFPIFEIIVDSDAPVEKGDVLLGREAISYLFSIYEGFNASNENMPVAYVSYDPSVKNEAVAVTREGWRALISDDILLDTQIKKLELALKEKIGDKRKTLQYVDLRVKDRVYFK